MDTRKAAYECRNLIVKKSGCETKDFWETKDFNVSAQHCLDMCDKILSGKISGEKSHRWIGWVQACICVNRLATLDELKIINKIS